jgi:hypothetical protein
LIRPSFDVGCLRCILFTGELNAHLDFAECNGGQMQIALLDAAQPRQNAPMRFSLPQFGYDVGVEEIHCGSLGGARRSASEIASRRNVKVRPCKISEQQFLERRLGCVSKPFPFR